jgi:hypothetical protein
MTQAGRTKTTFTINNKIKLHTSVGVAKAEDKSPKAAVAKHPITEGTAPS